MNYILVLLPFLLIQSVVSDDSQNRRNINESFDVNIGAGYAVGLDQSSNNTPPNGSSNINLSKNYYSGPLKTETKPQASVRGPRILTNFTPHIANPIPETPKSRAESQPIAPNSGPKEHYSASSSNIHSYNAPIFPTPADEHFDEPHLVDFQKILNDVETRKPFSKIMQVIKVPAIYEIHFQSDDNEKKVNLDPTSNLFWKNYYENKPNVSTQYFGDYSKWVNNAHLQEESDKWTNVHIQNEQLSKGGEKYYDFSNIPVVSYENIRDSFEEKSKGNGILQPTIATHYSNTKTFPNYDSNKDVRTKYHSESFTKPTWISKEYVWNKKQPHAINNFKRHVVHNPRGPNPTAQPLHKDSYGSNVKNSSPFKHNQVITENDKPQALHEVPAPFLGKYPQLKPFESQQSSDSYYKLQTAPTTLYKHTNVKFNKLLPTTSKPSYNYKSTNGFLSFKPSNSFEKKKVDPSNKGNLVYGKKSGHVRTPYEINIPVTPGSTMVTVTENPYHSGKTSFQNFHYSTTIKRNINSFTSERPGILNTFNDHYQQVADLRQESSKRVLQTTEYPINDKNGFKTVEIPQKGVERNTLQSPTSILTTKRPDGNYYQQLADIPYQTQKSINSVDSTSTAPSSDIISVKATPITTSTKTPYEISHNSQVEQTVNKDSEKSVENIMTKHDLRRRVFDTDHNKFKKNRYMSINNGYIKNSQHSRISKRKSSGPRLDSIIYITRKSTH